MTCTITVKRLNPSGFHVSQPDTDRAFVSGSNPTGNFKVVVLPFNGTNGPFLRYQKAEQGYLVQGEGYILSGTEEEVKENVRKHKSNYFKEKNGKVEFLKEVI